MRKWLRELFYGKDEPVFEYELDPVVKEEYIPSDPTRAIVEAYLANPSRFKISVDRAAAWGVSIDIYDKLNKERFIAFMAKHGRFFSKPDWASDEDCRWAYDKVSEVATARRMRLGELVAIRKQRFVEHERTRLTKLYRG